MSEPLEPAALELSLAALSGWRLEENKLVREFEFRDFREAMSFLVRLSFEAEQRNHHPEIRNVYRSVRLALTTHDAGNQVTALDVELAAAIDALLG